ncbi:hypothetical protein F4818DRAFT_456053 [Hypoxylon cercidicola]|nr:hypothetical protein F4818DRAFT_456053 [Hypoxylon cercidicola]
MSAQSGSWSDATSAKDSNTHASPQGCTSSLGKRKRDEECIYYVATHYEVDKDNIIRGIHVDPHYLGGWFQVFTESQSDEKRSEGSKSTRVDSHQSPIQWRYHGEVAIEVTEYKQALVLHDLVDENNSNLMVLHKDHIIIQGSYDEAMKSWDIAKESLGVSAHELGSLSCVVVSGMEACQMRAKDRRGGLVDVKGKYIPMDWSKAERLMAKEFFETGGQNLVVLDFRLIDQSPLGNLKFGRRLVPIKDKKLVLIHHPACTDLPAGFSYGGW